jgi:hypothetical protein
MKRPGMQYKAIDLKRCKEMPELLSASDLDLLIDVAASLVDLESTIAPGPAARKVKSTLLASDNVGKGRRILSDYLNCDQSAATVRGASVILYIQAHMLFAVVRWGSVYPPGLVLGGTRK